jgi:hypothetical protein
LPRLSQTTQDAVQIFSLAVLLSSMFVYNQMGSIDEAALDRLSLVTELTRHIRVRATSAPGSEDSRELGGFNPTFLWLLRGLLLLGRLLLGLAQQLLWQQLLPDLEPRVACRTFLTRRSSAPPAASPTDRADFYHDLEDEGRRVSAREYLETALMPTAGRGQGVAAKNQIRDSIKALFPDRCAAAHMRASQASGCDATVPCCSSAELATTRLLVVRVRPDGSTHT